MSRAALIACVRLPALPLQIALRDAPGDTSPLALVEDERPESSLLFVNTAALRARIVPGMRQSTAQSLMPTLRVRVVSSDAVQHAVTSLVVALQTLSPRVEHDATKLGVFYVDPSGLERIHGGVEPFTRLVMDRLKHEGYRGAIAVAFDRDLAYVIACGKSRGTLIASSPEHARSLASRVSLTRLGLSPTLSKSLARLGLHTVGALATLPVDAVHARLGEEAARLARALKGETCLPIQPVFYETPIARTFDIDPPEEDTERLVFLSKLHLTDILREAGERGTAIVALRIMLSLDHGPTIETYLEPAAPTRDAALLTELWRLRLAAMTLVAGVARMHIGTVTTERTNEQLALFRPKRDVKAASRALARVRAAFGADAVVHAKLRDAHLPEARFVFTPSIDIPTARPRRIADLPLIRRIHGTPHAFDPLAHGLVFPSGPYRISGGWWVRTVERDYYYGETREGGLLFLYYDNVRKRFFVHGEVD